MLRRIQLQNIDAGIRRLFLALEDHLAVASMLTGLTPGKIYVDQPDDPQTGIAWFHSRVYVGGRPQSVQAWQDIYACLAHELIPQMQAARMTGFILHFDPELPESLIAGFLSKDNIYPGTRRCYVFSPQATQSDVLLAANYQMRPVDVCLLNEPELRGIDWLREEMISERPSVEDFLEKSFGVCLIHAGEIIGWCLSEYNYARLCEVGVAVAESFQRRGFGMAITRALLAEAFRRGYAEVGWHCWSKNRASAALAEHCGFRLKREFPVWFWDLTSPEIS